MHTNALIAVNKKTINRKNLQFVANLSILIKTKTRTTTSRLHQLTFPGSGASFIGLLVACSYPGRTEVVCVVRVIKYNRVSDA